ncbi:dTMP kinase [Streptomyces sp. NPDC050560]|uniref:dTMP kinase n=1 Tax=Streptomyces sp. NPDC050560 TaxID=3365630 RepID=UPI00379BA36F
MIVAVEGPSYAGKTTAIAALRHAAGMREVVFFDCYVKCISRPEDIPRPATTSAAEQLAAFETFMLIEEDRVRRLAGRSGVVVIDRSVDTLLAHAYALDEMDGFGVYDEARDRLQVLPHLRPDRTIYLDASAEVLSLRRKAARHADAEPDYFLHDAAFLTHARDYFCTPAREPVAAEITVVPGSGSREDTAAAVQALVSLWCGQ